jgi:hypothetical protein
MKRLVIRVAFLVVLAAFGWGAYRFVKQLPERHETLATTTVQRGEVVIRAYTRGELRAVRSVTLVAPNLFGTTQVTRLAPLGALARERDLIAEFDESERVAAREQAELNLEQVDEQIKMTKANQQVTAKQDAVNLIHARYEVRRAELDVQKNPILAEIDAKKNVLTLEQDKRALAQLESDVHSSRRNSRLWRSNATPLRLTCNVRCNVSPRPRSCPRSLDWWRSGKTARGITISGRLCPTFGKATPCSRACRSPMCWIFLNWKWSPRSGSSTGPI